MGCYSKTRKCKRTTGGSWFSEPIIPDELKRFIREQQEYIFCKGAIGGGKLLRIVAYATMRSNLMSPTPKLNIKTAHCFMVS